MKLAAAAQMKYMDDYTINTLGIPSLELMEHASYHIANFSFPYLSDNKNCAVFCGSGNNGGDGIGAAVFLKQRGINTKVFFTGKREKMTLDTKKMEMKYNSIGGIVEEFDPLSDEIKSFVMSCGVIIDAMFGTGLNSPLRGVSADAVSLINLSPAVVISADMPSGIETDTGKILGCAVKADITVTFSMAKIGQITMPGCFYCGKLEIAEIGIPKEVSDNIEFSVFSFDKSNIYLPKRPKNSHKSNFGKLLIISGSCGYTGAPVLSANAAVRSGSGLVFLGTPDIIYNIVASKCMEAMPFPLPSLGSALDSSALPDIMNRLQTCDVCLIGPGLGLTAEVSGIVHEIIEKSDIPLVIDADALTALSENLSTLKKAKCPVILTPHDGEFTRLGGNLSSGDRINTARDFAAAYNCILVLKGHRTITAFPDGDTFINTTGNPGMAKGGSGDVLAGIIASLVGQKFSLKSAIPLAVCIHGAAGDICAQKFGEYSMTPSDMISALPNVTKQ